MSTKLEKYLFDLDNVIADDNYITDGYILLSKEFVRNKVLKNFKTEQEDFMKYIPCFRGEDFKLSKKCELLPNKQIGICLDEQGNFVNYEFIDMFVDHLYQTMHYDIQFTKQRCKDKFGYYIKVFADKDDKETFVGVIMSIATIDKCKKG